MAKKKGRKWSPFRAKRRQTPEPKIDHSRPFSEQLEQLQSHIDHRRKSEPKLPKSNLAIDEVIISREQIGKITYAWLYEPEEPRKKDQPPRKQRLAWLMLLYGNPSLTDLARKLCVGKSELLKAMGELARLERG